MTSEQRAKKFNQATATSKINNELMNTYFIQYLVFIHVKRLSNKQIFNYGVNFKQPSVY